GRPGLGDLRHLVLFLCTELDTGLQEEAISQSALSLSLCVCVCVRETGIGKSTLMDTLFNTKFESDPATHNEPGVRLKARSYELQESNVRLKLTIVDTVGFGDQINKDDRVKCGMLFKHAISPQVPFESLPRLDLMKKRGRNSPRIPPLFSYNGNGSHVCLNFMHAGGSSVAMQLDYPGLRSGDLAATSVTPLIARVDTVTEEGCLQMSSKSLVVVVLFDIWISDCRAGEETQESCNGQTNKAIQLSLEHVGKGTKNWRVGEQTAEFLRHHGFSIPVAAIHRCGLRMLRQAFVRIHLSQCRKEEHTQRKWECTVDEFPYGLASQDENTKGFSVLEALRKTNFPMGLLRKTTAHREISGTAGKRSASSPLSSDLLRSLAAGRGHLLPPPPGFGRLLRRRAGGREHLPPPPGSERCSEPGGGGNTCRRRPARTHFKIARTAEKSSA
ncbi:septin-11 isoform X1, partial [Podarcis lilfordi]